MTEKSSEARNIVGLLKSLGAPKEKTIKILKEVLEILSKN